MIQKHPFLTQKHPFLTLFDPKMTLFDPKMTKIVTFFAFFANFDFLTKIDFFDLICKKLGGAANTGKIQNNQKSHFLTRANPKKGPKYAKYT